MFALTTAGALFTLAATDVRADLAAASKAYGTLLGKYVTPRGVKYDAWRADGADLKKVAEIAMILRTTEPKPLPPEERKALIINLYNRRSWRSSCSRTPRARSRSFRRRRGTSRSSIARP
jgi:hypothetical protein